MKKKKSKEITETSRMKSTKKKDTRWSLRRGLKNIRKNTMMRKPIWMQTARSVSQKQNVRLAIGKIALVKLRATKLREGRISHKERRVAINGMKSTNRLTIFMQKNSKRNVQGV